jgi:hypothetical protein
MGPIVRSNAERSRVMRKRGGWKPKVVLPSSAGGGCGCNPLGFPCPKWSTNDVSLVVQPDRCGGEGMDREPRVRETSSSDRLRGDPNSCWEVSSRTLESLTFVSESAPHEDEVRISCSKDLFKWLMSRSTGLVSGRHDSGVGIVRTSERGRHRMKKNFGSSVRRTSSSG